MNAEEFEKAMAEAQTVEELRANVVERLKSMRSVIMADGKIDEEEVGHLIRASKPIFSLAGDDLRAFLMALRSALDDGEVTKEESAVLSEMYSAVVDPSEDICPRCERHLPKGHTRCPWCATA